MVANVDRKRRTVYPESGAKRRCLQDTEHKRFPSNDEVPYCISGSVENDDSKGGSGLPENSLNTRKKRRQNKECATRKQHSRSVNVSTEPCQGDGSQSAADEETSSASYVSALEDDGPNAFTIVFKAKRNKVVHVIERQTAGAAAVILSSKPCTGGISQLNSLNTCKKDGQLSSDRAADSSLQNVNGRSSNHHHRLQDAVDSGSLETATGTNEIGSKEKLLCLRGVMYSPPTNGMKGTLLQSRHASQPLSSFQSAASASSTLTFGPTSVTLSGNSGYRTLGTAGHLKNSPGQLSSETCSRLASGMSAICSSYPARSASAHAHDAPLHGSSSVKKPAPSYNTDSADNCVSSACSLFLSQKQILSDRKMVISSLRPSLSGKGLLFSTNSRGEQVLSKTAAAVAAAAVAAAGEMQQQQILQAEGRLLGLKAAEGGIWAKRIMGQTAMAGTKEKIQLQPLERIGKRGKLGLGASTIMDRLARQSGQLGGIGKDEIVDQQRPQQEQQQLFEELQARKTEQEISVHIAGAGREDNAVSDSEKEEPQFVLSSGRNRNPTASQDSSTAARAPTIDDEFEQYFSQLLL
eukprot:TRINITY_DN883_c0_g1_i4.p1 TRINITY_DN883_c0_g1~~TRINITY_DN883_c0_g1_i4.p1  ORF type:complete len:579 (+),score=142.46 TRINITY_DN883_c0_g1_i4:226-1962(+)